jgi:hypothetical protein
MNLLSTIIERLNQRVEAGNIFDQIYGLCELSADGNDKAWIHYIGNGQAIPVTNFDAKQGTIFWAKRGKISVSKNESLKLAGCKALYETKFTLSAYAVVRKDHLPCDSADAQDWIASRVLRLVSGSDPQFKTAIGVVAYEVVPNGYVNEIKSLTANYEWACVSIDVDVNVLTSSEDGCYDTCATGDIPLPDFLPCTPCLTEVAVDGITIIGNGTVGDPLIAIGGGGGGGALIALPFTTDHLAATGNAYAVGNIVWYLGNVYRCIAANDSILPTNTSYWVNLGAGFPTVQQPSNWNATSGNNQILNKPTIPAAQVNSDWNASSGVAEILNKPTIPVLPSTIVESVTATAPLTSSGGANPDIAIPQATASADGYLDSADWSTFNGKFNAPTGNNTQYLDGAGTPTTFPTIPPAQVNSDWNAVSGVAEILNKPTIPAAQIQSDWNQANNAALDFIKNKPSIPSTSGLVPYTGATTNVDLGTHTLSAKDLVINHPSGSGVAASITKGGSGEALTVVKSSGSGNAASITGGVTLIDELHLTTDLADAYIASAATWNAKFNTPSGTTAQYVRGDGSLATFPTVPLIYKDVNNQTAVTGVTTNTKVVGVLIPANTITVGAIVEIKARMTKPAGSGLMTLRVYANTADSIVSPAPTLLMTGASVNINNNYTGIDRSAIVKSATVTQTASAASSVLNDASSFQGVVTNSNVDWTVNQYIIFAIQNGSALDATTLSYYQIEIK